MARNYANIVTAIWRHAEFRALNSREQWLFLFLVTQPNISAVGVLPLTLGRWSSCAEDITADDIRAGMTILQGRRFIVFDPATDEVLVRSFVRWDGGHTNPKRRPVIMRAAVEVESNTLRRSIAAEFDRLGLDSNGLLDSLSGRLPDTGSQTMENKASGPAIAVSAGHLGESSPDLFSQEDSLSDSQCGSLSADDGVVVTKALVVSTADHIPQAATQTQQDGKTKPETLEQRTNRLARIYTDVVKTSNFMGTRTAVKAAINDSYTDEQISAALTSFAEHRDKTVTATLLRLVLEGKPVAEIGVPFPARVPAYAGPYADSKPERDYTKGSL